MIKEINGFAELQHSTFSTVDVAWVLDINSFSLSRVSRLFGADQAKDNFLCLPCSTDDTINSVPTSSQSQHRQALSSLGFTFDGSFDLRRLKIFLANLLYNKVTLRGRQHASNSVDSSSRIETDDNVVDEEQIYRLKGLLRINGQQYFYILQAVHDVFDLQPSDYCVEGVKASGGEDVDGAASVGENAISSSRIIVIGHHLEADALLRGFQSCLHGAPTRV